MVEVKRQTTTVPKKLGRHPAVEDRALLHRMAVLIVSREVAPKPETAARRVCEEFKKERGRWPGNSERAGVKRLAQKYTESRAILENDARKALAAAGKPNLSISRVERYLAEARAMTPAERSREIDRWANLLKLAGHRGRAKPG